MQQTNKFNSMMPRLLEEASKSTINSQLAAALFKGQKMISSQPRANTNRNVCRGHNCGSLHAEAHAIIDHFGKDLTFNPNIGWCFFPGKQGKKPPDRKEA